jgi:hypothetical protein
MHLPCLIIFLFAVVSVARLPSYIQQEFNAEWMVVQESIAAERKAIDCARDESLPGCLLLAWGPKGRVAGERRDSPVVFRADRKENPKSRQIKGWK